MMEGKISKEFRRVQAAHIATTDTTSTIDSWLSGFISRLLETSHGQWIYRCTTLHHITRGTKALQHRVEVQEKIRQYSAQDPRSIPLDCRHLLACPTKQILLRSTANQLYWVTAMEAANAAASVRTAWSRKRKRLSSSMVDSPEDTGKWNRSNHTQLRTQALTNAPKRFRQDNNVYRRYASNKRKRPD